MPIRLGDPMAVDVAYANEVSLSSSIVSIKMQAAATSATTAEILLLSDSDNTISNC